MAFYLSYVSMLQMNGERECERSLALQDLSNIELKVALTKLKDCLRLSFHINTGDMWRMNAGQL